MRHIPLAEFINAFIDAGLTITHVNEPDEEPVPYAIVIAATKVPASQMGRARPRMSVAQGTQGSRLMATPAAWPSTGTTTFRAHRRPRARE